MSHFEASQRSFFYGRPMEKRACSSCARSVRTALPASCDVRLICATSVCRAIPSAQPAQARNTNAVISILTGTSACNASVGGDSARLRRYRHRDLRRYQHSGCAVPGTVPPTATTFTIWRLSRSSGAPLSSCGKNAAPVRLRHAPAQPNAGAVVRTTNHTCARTHWPYPNALDAAVRFVPCSAWFRGISLWGACLSVRYAHATVRGRPGRGADVMFCRLNARNFQLPIGAVFAEAGSPGCSRRNPPRPCIPSATTGCETAGRRAAPSRPTSAAVRSARCSRRHRPREHHAGTMVQF